MADALEWIMRKQGIVDILHLDDFLFLNKTQNGEYDILHLALHIYEELGVPVAPEKVTGLWLSTKTKPSKKLKTSPAAHFASTPSRALGTTYQAAKLEQNPAMNIYCQVSFVPRLSLNVGRGEEEGRRVWEITLGRSVQSTEIQWQVLLQMLATITCTRWEATE